jgi:hypothetical protein
LAAANKDSGGRIGYTAPGDREFVWFGCCQKDWGNARSFIGTGSETQSQVSLQFKTNISFQMLTNSYHQSIRRCTVSMPTATIIVSSRKLDHQILSGSIQARENGWDELQFISIKARAKLSMYLIN